MQAGPQRPGEESRTILEKNPVKLEENWSGENSCESGEKFRYLTWGLPGGGEAGSGGKRVEGKGERARERE